MTRFLHLCRWLSLLPTALFVSGALVLAGCDSAQDVAVAPTIHPDVTKNQNAMEEFQKKNPKFGRAGGLGSAKQQ